MATGLEQLAKDYLEIMASHDLSRAPSVFADNLRCHFGAADSPPLSRDEWVGMVTGWLTAFPDLKPLESFTIIDEANSRFAVQMSWTATHTGPFMSIPPTGRRVQNGGVSTFRVENGRVAEEWVFEDVANLMAQLTPSAS